MRRYSVVFAVLALAVVQSSNALAQFGASVYQTSGTYTAMVTGSAEAINGATSVGTGSGNINFTQTPGIVGLGNVVGFHFSAYSSATAIPGYFGSSSIGGTAYITWLITGPTSSAPYDVIVTTQCYTTNSAWAEAYKNGDNSYGHASGPVGSANAVASGPNGYNDDWPATISQPSFHRVTIDVNGNGYIIVPFIAQCESQAYGPLFSKRTGAEGIMDCKVQVVSINFAP